MISLIKYLKIIWQYSVVNDFELTLFVTNYCNEACEHCFYSAELNTKKPELDTESYRRIARTLPSYCRKVIFAGGEPFMRSDLSELVAIFREAGVREFNIVTNGTLTEKILRFADDVRKFSDISVHIQVSLDGPEEIHDKVRKHKGAFQRAIHTLQQLQGKGVAHGVQTAISKSNYRELKSFDQYIWNTFHLWPHYQFVRGAEVSGLPDDLRNSFNPPDMSLIPDNDETKIFLDVLRGIYQERIKKANVFLASVFNYTGLESKYAIAMQRKNIFPCIAGQKRGVIYPTGDTAICEYIKTVPEKIQDLNYDFKKLWNSDAIKQQEKVAKGCHCTHGCYINITGTWRFFFYMLRNMYRLKFKPGFHLQDTIPAGTANLNV